MKSSPELTIERTAMKTLKIILLVLAILIAVPLLVALFIDNEYAVERDVVIERSKTEVFDYIRYLKNQDNYSVWAGMDPDMRTSHQGVDGTVGFIASWESDKDDVGKGEQEIVGITDGERIDYALRFIEPFESQSTAYMTTEAIDEYQTRVRWGFRGVMSYPMNLMLVVMNMEEAIGNDLQNGLDELKRILEQE